MIDFTYEEIIEYIERLKNLNILVIGETIIDEYQFGYTLGKAGKFPIVAFQNEKLERYDGGIRAICNHLNDFVNEIGWITGKDIIIKKRYVQNGQKLFETYSKKRDEYCTDLEFVGIDNADLVIVADFGHGAISKEQRKLIERDAKFIVLNTQFNAGNMGMNTINKYDRYDYICIDENELRLATSNQYEDIESIILNRFNDVQTVSITLSKKGTMVYKNGKVVHIDALIDKPIDTVGAGDAFLSITSPLAYLGSPPEIIGFVGNAAGAIACNYVGNKESLNKDKLYKFIKREYEKRKRI